MSWGGLSQRHNLGFGGANAVDAQTYKISPKKHQSFAETYPATNCNCSLGHSCISARVRASEIIGIMLCPGTLPSGVSSIPRCQTV